MEAAAHEPGAGRRAGAGKRRETACSTLGELAALSAALERIEERFPASVAAIRVAALTGLRISEVCSDPVAARGALRAGALRYRRRKRAGGSITSRTRRSRSSCGGCRESTGAINVFAVDARGPLTYRTARTHFGEAAKLAGLGDVRLHDLRRTVMTNAAAAGVGVHVLRDLLGHKTTAMADRYVRSVGSPVADARRAIGAGMAAAMAGGGVRK